MAGEINGTFQWSKTGRKKSLLKKSQEQRIRKIRTRRRRRIRRIGVTGRFQKRRTDDNRAAALPSCPLFDQSSPYPSLPVLLRNLFLLTAELEKRRMDKTKIGADEEEKEIALKDRQGMQRRKWHAVYVHLSGTRRTKEHEDTDLLLRPHLLHLKEAEKEETDY